MQNGVIIVEVFIVIAGHAYSITVLLIFHWHLYLFIFFSSKWDQVVSLLVPKPQNFTEQKMFQTDSKTQVCDPQILATQ